MQLAIFLLALATVGQAFPHLSQNSTTIPDFWEAETSTSFKQASGSTPRIYKESENGQHFDIANMNTNQLFLKANTASISNQKSGRISGDFVKDWDSTEMQIFWDINLLNAGSIEIVIGIANDKDNSGSIIAVSIGDSSVTGETIFSGGWKQIIEIDLGNLEIAQPGNYTVSVRAKTIRGSEAGYLSYVLLRGSALEGATEVSIPKGCDALHLRWGGMFTKTFYNAIQVIETVPGTYFATNGFKGGYFGIQDNDYSGRKRVIFSIWDYNGHPIDPNLVSEDNRPVLVEKAPDVVFNRFGNEGTGLHTHMEYSWKVGKTYHFVMQATTLEKAVQYSAYFYLEEKDEWKRMAVIRVKNENPLLLSSLYSFVEDFKGDRGRYPRTAIYGPVWLEQTNGMYNEVTSATFTRSGKRGNSNSGLEKDGRLYLKTGGTTVQTVPIGYNFKIPKSGQMPSALAKFINDIK